MLALSAALSGASSTAGAADVFISKPGGYLFQQQNVSSGSLTLDSHTGGSVSGSPLTISEIRLVHASNPISKFEVKWEADRDIDLNFQANKNQANVSSIVMDGSTELAIFKAGSGHTLTIRQGDADNRGEGAVIVNEDYNNNSHASLRVYGNLVVEHYARSCLGPGVIHFWDNTAAAGGDLNQNPDPNVFYVEGDLRGYSDGLRVDRNADQAFLAFEGTRAMIDGNTDISMNYHVKEGTIYGALVTPGNSLHKPEAWFGTAGGVTKFHDINLVADGNSAEAYGIYADSSDVNGQQPGAEVIVVGDAVIENISAQAQSTGNNASAWTSGVESHNSASVTFVKGLVIRNLMAIVGAAPAGEHTGAFGEGAEAYALAAFDGGVIQFNPYDDPNAIVQIENDILSYGGDANGQSSTVKAKFLNANSHFIGLTPERPKGAPTAYGLTHLTFADQAYWQVPSDNTLHGSLTLNDGNVYLGTSPGTFSSTTDTNYTTLTVDELKGTGGTIYMRADIDGERSDKLIVKQGSGAHSLIVKSTGSEPSKEAMDSFLVWQENGTASFDLANEGGTVDAGVYLYSLTQRPSNTNGTEWYLVRNNDEPTPPGGDGDGGGVFSPTAESVLALAGGGAQSALYLAQLSDLRKRLGETRGTVKDGLWATVGAQRDRVSGFVNTGMKQEAYRFNLGFDRVSDQWVYGANFKAVTANQYTRDTQFKGKSEAHSEGLNLYGAWQNEEGDYADIVLTADRHHQKIQTKMLDGTPVYGRSHNYGFGLSVEGGRKLLFTDDETLFLEPQACWANS